METVVIDRYAMRRATKALPKKKRVVKSIRSKKARKDASIGSITRTIERKLGLPKGSVILVYPSNRKARVDATVSSLKARWEKGNG